MAKHLTIRNLRYAADLTQGELAEAVGVTQASVSRWEAGTVTPGGDKIMALADTLGVTLEAIGKAVTNCH